MRKCNKDIFPDGRCDTEACVIGIIAPTSVKEYLNRPRDSHSWMKKLTDEELDAALAELGFKVARKKFPLDKHQKVCAILGIAYKTFAFWLDMGCVDGDTEYLTPTGWVKIRDYKEGPVAQYNLDGTAEFVTPLRYIKRPCSKMYHFKTTRGCDQMLSPEHNILFVSGMTDPTNVKCTNLSPWKRNMLGTAKGFASKTSGEQAYYKASAEELVEAGKNVRFPTCFNLSLSTRMLLTDEQLRVQVAVHADGSVEGCTNSSKKPKHRPARCCINVKKQRKKDRIEKLLEAANIPYKRTNNGIDGFSQFTFIPPLATKKFGLEWW